MFDIGVTRKSGTTSAAATAAIGELAQYVAVTFDKPFALQVAALASVVFDIEVSENRVRQSLKARNRRYTKLVRSPR
jgi:predicted transcriptional regulator